MKHSITELSQVKQVINKRLQQFKLAHHDGAVVVAVRDTFHVERCIFKHSQEHSYEENECLNRGSHLMTDCPCERLCLHLTLLFLVLLQPLDFVDYLRCCIVHEECDCSRTLVILPLNSKLQKASARAFHR